ncbi:MAG: phage major capsid protein, P2 family [Desulfovibrio sp.]|nr:phage major capsid protein, P2 family [Desulfovibrio sp.]|tara:strand:- start:858 stop:1895 length:1038 start_codon:yes stop_codon:yes gene_type:complete
MEVTTREMYQQLCDSMGESYGVQNVHQQFAVEPSIQQELQDKIIEQSEFLQLINGNVPVRDMKGQVIYGSANSSVLSRTDTSGNGERVPANVLGLDPKGYELHKTNGDVALPYATMDSWSMFPDLSTRYTRYVQEAIANGKEIIGWYGETVAITTDKATFPMLQDVNKGWMQYMRENNPAHIIKEGVPASGVIKIGPGGDYTNLDHAVSDMKRLIPRHKRKDLIVLVGDELVSEEHTQLMEAIGMDPQNKVLAKSAMSTIGGLSWMTPSNFPSRGLVVTPLKNLSIYTQKGSWRRHLKDNPSKDRVEDFNSFNEGYVVEDVEAFVALEFKDDNIKVTRDGGQNWV